MLKFLLIHFVERAGAEVVECACVIGLSDLKVLAKLNHCFCKLFAS